MKKQPIPNILLKIVAFFVVVDFFALQKPLPSFVGWLLIVTPLVLLAITCFIRAYHKQFPIPLNRLFPFLDFNNEFLNIFRAIIFGLFFSGLAIMFTISYFSK